MNKVTVYRFQVLDRRAVSLVPAPRMPIVATIRRLKAEADLESALEVDCAAVDEKGFYTGPPDNDSRRSSNRRASFAGIVN